MSLKDFQIMAKLGEGAYSTVYRVKRLIDNQEYAMKKVKMNNLSEKERQNALNQVRILASISHPNVIAYKEAFIEKGSNYLYIIMEYANDGDLLAKIKEHQKMNTSFSQPEVWSIFIQITQGLKILHDMKILHRDIKSANVFLNKNGEAKLGDMNVSKMVKSMCQTQTGTPYYASPQIWKDQPYDKKSDIWSLGCVLYEAIALKPPFRANDMEGLYKKVIRGFYPRLPPEYSNDISIVMKMLLQVAPHLRSSCDKILQLPIVMKHFVYLPETLNGGSLKGNANLMKTIKIYNTDSTNELAKKVELPKSRYLSSFEEAPSIEKSKNFSFSSKESCMLPRVSKTIEYEKSRVEVESEWNKKSEIVRKLIEPKREVPNSLPEGLPEGRPKKILSHLSPSPRQTEKRLPRLYEGRLRQIEPRIMEKIIRNEKEKQKIRSIIGNN